MQCQIPSQKPRVTHKNRMEHVGPTEPIPGIKREFNLSVPIVIVEIKQVKINPSH